MVRSRLSRRKNRCSEKCLAQNRVKTRRSRAIVIGASIAGLLAARVLADHFEQVTVLERDDLPASPQARSGVPQARHTHALLVRGRIILERLFPGLIDELVGDGATLFDSSAEVRFLSPFGWLPRIKTDFYTTACSRDLLEWHIRRRLAEHSNVTLVPQADVSGLLLAGDGAAVGGVTVRWRGAAADRPNSYPSDLVLDASGRDSRAPDWLAALGYPRPPETTVNSYLGYATRTYTRPEGDRDWVVATLQAQPPDLRRGGVILPIEGGRWIVTLIGYGRDYPPLDEVGFMEFIRSLADPLLFDALSDAQPLTPIVGYQRTENHMRHYERLADWPQGFVVAGDAVCGFNPIYAQGMTNAAICATMLDTALQDGDAGFAARFQKQLAEHNRTPWLLATNEDLRFPTTQGERPPRAAWLAQRYIDRVALTALVQDDVFVAFFSVVHMLAGPGSLFRPSVVAKVLWHTLMDR